MPPETAGPDARAFSPSPDGEESPDRTAHLAAGAAQKLLLARLRKKFAAGLGIAADIALLAELPKGSAAVALLDVFKLDLRHGEKVAFARAAQRGFASCGK